MEKDPITQFNHSLSTSSFVFLGMSNMFPYFTVFSSKPRNARIRMKNLPSAITLGYQQNVSLTSFGLL